MKRNLKILALTGLLGMLPPAAGAAVIVDAAGEVTGTSGSGDAASGFKDDFLPGDAVSFAFGLADVPDLPDLPFAAANDLFEANIGIAGTGGNGSILLQACCGSFTDADPTDGAITLSGGVGGFTVSPSIAGGLGTDSGDGFSLTFSVSGDDVPAASFTTIGDFIAFLNADSLVFEGFAGLGFTDFETDEAFTQFVEFQGAANPVPLPSAFALFGTGFLILRPRGR
ncbi:hypothetical protein [Parvularcula dongshanensis]|uniref:PEP-CTERM sorting domain-containing protein n=1 Tax=Parvularcula dongshanensis TaxID=1173995 RepID=A0A840I009_9PROT|nr:hypothetical protein [Parvularcula dongshanensis]MBB4658017.1 hypothetical protein [Parvularcula dongshanensis]